MKNRQAMASTLEERTEVLKRFRLNRLRIGRNLQEYLPAFFRPPFRV